MQYFLNWSPDSSLSHQFVFYPTLKVTLLNRMVTLLFCSCKHQWLPISLRMVKPAIPSRIPSDIGTPAPYPCDLNSCQFSPPPPLTLLVYGLKFLFAHITGSLPFLKHANQISPAGCLDSCLTTLSLYTCYDYTLTLLQADAQLLHFHRGLSDHQPHFMSSDNHYPQGSCLIFYNSALPLPNMVYFPSVLPIDFLFLL